MASLAEECYAFIAHSPAVQHSLLDAFTAAADALLAANPLSPATANFPLPHSSGHPPYPHEAHRTERSQLCAAPHVAHGVDPARVALSLPTTLDAFAVMLASPALGQALMDTDPDVFQAAFAAAASRWLASTAAAVLQGACGAPGKQHASGEAVGGGGGSDRSSAAAKLARCPEACVHALAADRLDLHVPVLVLRVPHFFAWVWANGQGTAGAADERAEEEEEDDEEEGREVLAVRNRHGCVPPVPPQPPAPPPLPLDAFYHPSIGGVAGVRVLGVVHEVFYDDVRSGAPAPWVTLLLLPPAGDAVGIHRLPVDLRGVDPPAQQRAAACVGQLVEVHGQLRTYGAPVVGEYVAATGVWVPLSPQERRRLAAAGGAGGAHAMDNSQGSEPAEAVGAVLPAAAEERAGRLAVRMWEGARVAFGVADAVLPSAADPVAPPLDFTPFVAVSTDTVVALLVTIAAAQTLDGDDAEGGDGEWCGGASLLLVDDLTPPLLPSFQALLTRVVPTAVVDVSPVVAHRVHGAFFLPSYGAAVRAQAPRQRGRPGARVTETATVPPAHAEVIRGGALTHARHRTLVLSQVEHMRSSALRLLKDFLSSRPVPVTGPCALSPAAQLAPPLPLTTTAEAPVGPLVVHRTGGQAVPFRTTRSVVLTVRDGKVLGHRQVLFQLAEHVDVIVHPAIRESARAHLRRACGDVPGAKKILCGCRRTWRGILGEALALPHSGAFTPPADAARHWLYAAPRLTSVCGELLRAYFLAARAMCAAEEADAAMMDSLVRLTRSHAALRTRCSYGYYTRLLAAARAGQRVGTAEDSRAAEEEAVTALAALTSGPPTTALVDALVAIGLCEGTLYFLSEQTLLGRCVIEMVAGEADREVRQRMGILPDSDGGGEAGGDLVQLVERRSRLEAIGPALDGDQVFSIIDMVADLQHHLHSGINRASRQWQTN